MRPGRFRVPEDDEMAWPEAAVPEPALAEPARAEPVAPEPAPPGPARTEPEPARAELVRAEPAPAEPAYSGTAPVDAVARRTPSGWRVGDEEVPDLTSAMVLADILAAELSSAEQSGLDDGSAVTVPPPVVARADAPPAAPRPGTGPRESRTSAPGPSPTQPPAQSAQAQQQETEQLKETVAQLEHALTVRVRVEQAIGVLAERHRLRPRQAFELLRSASRARGQRIMVTASQVIASASNPLLRLPDELAKPPMPRRLPRRSHGQA